jgi:GntR family transcriptional regulator, transcriptional repressor for pyruvate dehydrogenase complex
MSKADRRGIGRNSVAITADALRQRSFAAEPGALLGSLHDLAKALGVGIVTFQQAARVLEHEGLLEARRGPRGGYYAARPNAAALERALAAFLRTRPTSFGEALNITSLLFTELAAAAASCNDVSLLADLRSMQGRLRDEEDFDVAAFEHDFQHLLFRMVDWPLFELMTQVTLRFAESDREGNAGQSTSSLKEWRRGRERIVAAILGGDRELARFEAERSNRLPLLKRLVHAGATKASR